MLTLGSQLFKRTLLLTLVVVGLLPLDGVWSQEVLSGQSPKPIAEKDQARVTMTIELGELELAAFRRSGLLRTNVPANYQGQVDAIEVKRAVSFKVDHYLLNDAIDKINDSLSLKINESDIERLDYQPIKAKVYYDGFSTVVMALDRNSDAAIDAAKTEVRPTKSDSPKFFVRIDDRRGFAGFIKDLAELELKTDFGKLNVEADKIAGVRFNVDSQGGVAVELKSGETFLGKPSFDSISMKCSWGIEELRLSDIESVTVDRRARFIKPSREQNQWRLELKSNPPGSTVNRVIGGKKSDN